MPSPELLSPEDYRAIIKKFPRLRTIYVPATPDGPLYDRLVEALGEGRSAEIQYLYAGETIYLRKKNVLDKDEYFKLYDMALTLPLPEISRRTNLSLYRILIELKKAYNKVLEEEIRKEEGTICAIARRYDIAHSLVSQIRNQKVCN
jgi:hypothetical protein